MISPQPQRADANCTKCIASKRPTQEYLDLLAFNKLPYICNECREKETPPPFRFGNRFGNKVKAEMERFRKAAAAARKPEGPGVEITPEIEERLLRVIEDCPLK